MPARLLLGPQRPFTNLGDAMRKAAIPDGRLAVISAGWQEAEGDIDDVREAAQRDLVDLRLYHRAEQLFADDPDLHAAYRLRQDKLIELQRLYRMRLRQLTLAARRTLRAQGDTEMIAAEVRHAVSQLRALDRHHANRVEAIHGEFERSCLGREVPQLAAQVEEIAEVLRQHDTVLITGGNVLVLLNRMRLFGLREQLQGKCIVAWSAGAMALGSQVVLYHDMTPQGRRDPELLGQGMCILPDYILLPDATRRLNIHDRVRMDLFKRRFAPDRCVTLDSGAHVHLEDQRIASAELAKRVDANGVLTRVAAA